VQAPDISQFQQLLASIAALAIMIFPVIGITGGIKGLFKLIMGKTRDLKVGPWTIPDGVYISWSVAGILLLWGNLAGWMTAAPDFVTSPQLWGMFQWSTLALLANGVRNWAGIGAEEAPPLATKK
jgi:hypothetical protein